MNICAVPQPSKAHAWGRVYLIPLLRACPQCCCAYQKAKLMVSFLINYSPYSESLCKTLVSIRPETQNDGGLCIERSDLVYI